MEEELWTRHEVIPSARRLVNSLRDIGYDFVRAVADIIDNSIEANATQVSVQMTFDGTNSWIRISDNGCGMTGERITEAMRFGSEREYHEGELGKFGLGMKTASISQCRRLTVASRCSKENRTVEIRQLDLDEISETNRWEIAAIPPGDSSQILTEPLNDNCGTVVLWEDLDRMLNYKIPDGQAARKGFLRMARDLEDHLAMVFHRFLSGELGPERTLNLKVNGNEILPWDPFARDEGATVAIPPTRLTIATTSGIFGLVCSPFILPSKEKFSTPEAFRRFSGISKWNSQQGFYIYRENRMIQAGGWNRMRTSDEHTKLARVALDVHSDADSALGLNIMKTSINLPENMRKALQPIIENVIKWAKKAYSPETRDHAYQTIEDALGSDFPSEPHEAGDPSGVSTSYVETQSLKREVEATLPDDTTAIEKKPAYALEEAAKEVGELPALLKIREKLKSDDPETAEKIGW